MFYLAASSTKKRARGLFEEVSNNSIPPVVMGRDQTNSSNVLRFFASPYGPGQAICDLDFVRHVVMGTSQSGEVVGSLG